MEGITTVGVEGTDGTNIFLIWSEVRVDDEDEVDDVDEDEADDEVDEVDDDAELECDP